MCMELMDSGGCAQKPNFGEIIDTILVSGLVAEFYKFFLETKNGG
jgi:hypothetical protein